jgi:predicted metal-binding membrane protein
MSSMGEMSMPGGWTMSMAWMRMPGQSWPAAAASFLGMWTTMMVAMMLPSLVPMLWQFRDATGAAAQARLNGLTALVGAGYFIVWTAIGMAVYPLGIALTSLTMHFSALASAVPFVVGVIVLVAGGTQFSAWKAHQLECCRKVPVRDRQSPANARTAWRYGLRLGVHCSLCTSGLTGILFVVGIMDLRAMSLVTVAITAERLAPDGARAARAIGAVVVPIGLLLIARAIVLA